MRVIHVVQSLDPKLGGPPIVVSQLASAQARLGIDVAIVTGDGGLNLEGAEPALGMDICSGRLPVRTTDISPGIPGFLDKGFVRFMEPMATQGTLFHLHGVWEPMLKLSSGIARKSYIPYVVAPHGMLDGWSLQTKTWKKRLALALGYRAMLNEASFLHALNENEVTQVGLLGIKARAEIIPNGINVDGLMATDATSSESTRTAPYILFLGRLHFKKGLDYLAEAFDIVARRCPEAKLVVAGPDYGEKASFEQRISTLGLSDRVELVGAVLGEKKLDLIRQARCFCLPSRSEGFSIAALEAMACGTPVVLSTSCYFPEVAKAGAGYVVELDAREIATALSQLMEDKERAKAMGVAARNLVEQKYTWPEIAMRSIRCYEEVFRNNLKNRTVLVR